MKSKVLFFLLAVFATIRFSGFAQSDFRNGFVVTLENDTIRGMVKYQNQVANSSICVFKPAASSVYKSFTPEQINGYGFENGSFFTSSAAIKYMLPKPVFLEGLIKGKIGLYYYRQKEGQGRHFVAIKDSLKVGLHNALDTFYVNDHEARVIRAFGDKRIYRAQLRILMADRPDLFPQLDLLTYAMKDLTNIVSKYNERFEGNVKPDEALIAGHKVRWGMVASTGSSQLHLSDFSYQNNRNGFRYTDFREGSQRSIGALVNVQFRELHEKLSFQVEPSLSFSKYSSNVLHKSGSSYITHNIIDLDITAFKLPLSIKYSFYSSRWKATPFLRLGFAHQRFLSAKSNMQYTLQESTSSMTGSYSNFDFSDYQNSIFFAAGTDYKLKKGSVSAEVLLDGGDGIYRLKYETFLFHSWTKSLLFQVAYIFE